jgi:glycosyltransferase involved in cell wall biosynthesis
MGRMSLPDDVLEMLWLFQEWQRARGETVLHPIQKPRGVIDGWPDPKRTVHQEMTNTTVVDEVTKAAIDEFHERHRERMVPILARGPGDAETVKRAAEDGIYYVPESIDPVEEADKLATWEELRDELQLSERADLKWLEDIVDRKVMDKKAIRYLWKRTPRLRRRRSR